MDGDLGIYGSHCFGGRNAGDSIFFCLAQEHQGFEGCGFIAEDIGRSGVGQAKGMPGIPYFTDTGPISVQYLSTHVFFPQGSLGGFPGSRGRCKQDTSAIAADKGSVEQKGVTVKHDSFKA